MRFTVKAKGTFCQQLQDRAARWVAAKGMAARIVIPQELQFIYYQEYGVPAHVIEARDDNPSNMLAYPGPGGTVIAEHVAWPGIKPTRTITKSLDEIRTNASLLLQGALSSGGADNPSLVREALVVATNEAKSIISGGLAADLPGTRPYDPEHPKQSGRLRGETASAVFTELAEVDVIE